jgi:hypothetical protein
VNLKVAVVVFVGVFGFDVIVGAVTAKADEGIARTSSATSVAATTMPRFELSTPNAGSIPDRTDGRRLRARLRHLAARYPDLPSPFNLESRVEKGGQDRHSET